MNSSAHPSISRWSAAVFAIGLALASASRADERAIDAQVVVAAPIDAVWQAWTPRAESSPSSLPTPRSIRA